MSESTAIDLAQPYKITPLSEDLWKVQIPALAVNVVDRQFMEHLREAKQVIASQYGVPVELLEFREVLAREKTAQGVIVSLTINRLEVGQGKTILRLKPAKSPSGELFEDMIAEVDFYYLDEFGRVINSQHLWASFDKWCLARELLDFPAINRALHLVIENRSYVTNLIVARGKFPEIGHDAEFEYTFFPHPDAAACLKDYQTSRKVKAGDILCQKIPPTTGKIPGMTVRRHTQPPLKGLDFQLLAGEGTKLSRDGLRLTALRDGLAVMKRTMKRVYTSAGEKTIPAAIAISVEELEILDGDATLNLNADHSLEISGDLKEGSKIATPGEVLLTGNVCDGSTVTAGRDVLIEGTVEGAQIAAEGSVRGQSRVDRSSIQAEGDIVISEAAENSDLSGDSVSVLESLGCRIEARRKILLERAGDDSSGRKTVIRVG
ncbi:MAG TPA: FapA family protein, partial [bacterium]